MNRIVAQKSTTARPDKSGQGNADPAISVQPSIISPASGPGVRNAKEFSDERPSGTAGETPSQASVREPAPMYDESFARRAGEIIARAVRAAAHGVRRDTKRK